MIKILAFISFFSALSLFSQTENTEKEWVLKSFVRDQGHIWTSPFRMKKKDLKIVVPIVGITALSVAFDKEIYDAFQQLKKNHNWTNDLGQTMSYAGDEKTSLAVSTLFLGSGFLLKNKKAKQTALMGYQAFVHSAIVVQVIKHVASRQRPYIDGGKDKWNGPKATFKRYTESSSLYDAFPSGHSIVAWGMATVIAKQYKQHKWISITSYSLATVASLSRVTEGKHWLSDVIIGSSLGYGIGQFISKSHQNTKWTLLPSYWKNNAAITAVYAF